ncbi:hypothetical protein [Microbacterium sp. CPCC 204701]|uniref:hypothetical protein n=1 Tax=Microbacterium sp. CPCC 204701 TaxID=2493084 RepID=UPI0013E39C8A|nr:hypothetical protein [Microbacterium sp. CPCC 204701]
MVWNRARARDFDVAVDLADARVGVVPFGFDLYALVSHADHEAVEAGGQEIAPYGV